MRTMADGPIMNAAPRSPARLADIRRVLVVEDDPDAAANVCDVLELDDYDPVTACTIRDALNKLRGQRFLAIILDRKLPDGQAIEFLPEIRHLAPDAAVIVVTGYADIDGAVQALRFGASDYILKPINADVLRATLDRLRQATENKSTITQLSRDLARRQAELDTLLNVFPSDFAIAIAEDPECKFIHINESFANFLGIPREMNGSLSAEVTGRPDFTVVAGGRPLAPEELPVQRAAMHGRTVSAFEFEILRNGINIGTMLGYAKPLYDEQGQPRGAIGAFLDITERRRAARALEESQKRFHAIFQNSLDGLIVLDSSCKIVDANPAACEILGRDCDSLKDTPLDQFLTCRSVDGSTDWVQLITAGQSAGECLAEHDGTMLDIEYRAAANVLPGLHVVWLRDVTERKRAEQRGLQAERLAAIGETMAALVHESRNALQRSRACLEMLSMEVEQQPEAMDLVERALKAQDRLQQLYEEVRQYAAPLRLETEAADVAAVWRSAWTNLMPALRDKCLRLEESLDAVSFRCPIDRTRLEQVFINIFENALQVSPPNGEILLSCRDVLIDDQPGIEIAVRDQGPGMSREQRERIFEAFFTTKAKGTGLGMAIVQRIVQAHGGRIRVADADGPGAEIILTLPRSKP